MHAAPCQSMADVVGVVVGGHADVHRADVGRPRHCDGPVPLQLRARGQVPHAHFAGAAEGEEVAVRGHRSAVHRVQAAQPLHYLARGRVPNDRLPRGECDDTVARRERVEAGREAAAHELLADELVQPLPRRGVPDRHPAVAAHGHDLVAAAHHGDLQHPRRVHQLVQHLASAGVPDEGPPVEATRDHSVAAGEEGDARDGRRMGAELADRLAAGCVPDRRPLLGAPHQDPVARWEHRDAPLEEAEPRVIRMVLGRRQHMQPLARCHVPNDPLGLASASDHALAVREDIATTDGAAVRELLRPRARRRVPDNGHWVHADRQRLVSAGQKPDIVDLGVVRHAVVRAVRPPDGHRGWVAASGDLVVEVRVVQDVLEDVLQQLAVRVALAVEDEVVAAAEDVHRRRQRRGHVLLGDPHGASHPRERGNKCESGRSAAEGGPVPADAAKHRHPSAGVLTARRGSAETEGGAGLGRAIAWSWA
mmetsp:Transcript_12184/g.34822  ORF Transcript_12184/g.34822 Transcript_12184/m.34822 type:complete len:478 (-) Transcript_12184:2-1435(-)